MMCLKFFWLWLPALLAVLILTSATTTTEDDDAAADYLVEVNQTFSHYANLEMEARWDYITDISKEHEEAMVRSIVEAIFSSRSESFRGGFLFLSHYLSVPVPSRFPKFPYFNEFSHFTI